MGKSVVTAATGCMNLGLGETVKLTRPRLLSQKLFFMKKSPQPLKLTCVPLYLSFGKSLSLEDKKNIGTCRN